MICVYNYVCAGLGEAILCRSGRAVPLMTAHSPATCKEERERVKEAGGFISQDYRVNGVCGTSRLVGCYHLGPEVIPAPSTESIMLQPGDDYIILGSDSLWKHVSHELAIRIVRRASSASSAARELRDLAVGYGCKTDVSVIVVQLNIPEGSEPPVHSENLISELESDQNPDEDVEFTNIDDILSDTEDDMEWGHESTRNQVKLRKKNASAQVKKTEADIDCMILDAVSSPPTSPISPEMKSTNIDDILSSTPSHPDTQSTPHPSHKHTATYNETTTQMRGGRKIGTVSSHAPPPVNSLAYPAQTIPRDAAGSRTKGGDASPSMPPSQAVDYKQFKDSFEVTQSAPFIPTEHLNLSCEVGERGEIGGRGVQDDVGFGGSLRREKEVMWGRGRDTRGRGLRGNLTRAEVRGQGGNMDEYLVVLNQAMTELDSDTARGEPQVGGKIQRRLSYVEHSYKQLTNNVYSEGADIDQDEEMDSCTCW